MREWARFRPEGTLALDPAETPALHHADAATFLRHLRERGERPSLIYMDPPFLTNRGFHARRALRGDAGTPVEASSLAFSDIWPEGLDGYLAWLTQLLEQARSALHPEGSLLLHIDHRVAPYAAICCDRIFGPGDRQGTGTSPGFRNELIWTYGLGGSSARYWPRKHDTILWYTRSERWHFEAPRTAATSHRMRGRTKKMPDVLDIPAINNMAKERCGYPTQKPLALLTLLLRAHAPPGSLVVDPCCGSGTTLVAGIATGHRVMGADRGWAAMRYTRDRILQAGAPLRILRGAGRDTPPPLSLRVEGSDPQRLLQCDSPLSAVHTGAWRDGRFDAHRSLIPPGEARLEVALPSGSDALWVESVEGGHALPGAPQEAS